MSLSEKLRKNLHALGQVFTNRRVAALFALGFASGLPILLTRSTQQAWLKDLDVDLTTIGLFALVGLPYSFKFVWAPLLDRFQFPVLGRRRGWLLLTQAGLLVSIAAMGFINPAHAILAFAGITVLVAFLSASQDIVTDGYRADVLAEKDLAAGTTTFLLGYNLAVLVAGSGALLAADYLIEIQDFDVQTSWQLVYFGMAALMLVGIIATFLAPEPENPAAPPKTLQDAIIKPFAAFFVRRGALLAILFVGLYNLADALLGITTAFYLDLGFTKTDLATIRKFTDFAARLGGIAIGGVLVAKIGLRKSLWVGAFAIAVSNLAFTGLAFAGQNYPVFVVTVGLDSFCAGISQTAFIAFLLSLCDKRFSITQYALLTSAASLKGRILGAGTGYVAENLGWGPFFVFTTLAGIPTMILLYFLPRTLFQSASSQEDNFQTEGQKENPTETQEKT